MSLFCFKASGWSGFITLRARMMKLISAQVRKQFDTFNSSIGLPRLSSGSLVLFLLPCQVFLSSLLLCDYRPPPPTTTTSPQVFNPAVPLNCVFLPLGGWTDHEMKNSSPKQHRYIKCDFFFFNLHCWLSGYHQVKRSWQTKKTWFCWF